MGLLMGIVLAACGGSETTPRPYGYPRMSLPPHVYDTLRCDGCPFTFEYPAYGQVMFEDYDSCRFDIRFRKQEVRWHITLEWLSDDFGYHAAAEKYRGMVHTHSQKGRVYEEPIDNAEGLGRLYELYGEVPSPATAFYSDSTNWALEMAVYLPTALKNDSLAPMIEHMKGELKHTLQTFRFTGTQETHRPQATEAGCDYPTAGKWYGNRPHNLLDK